MHSEECLITFYGDPMVSVPRWVLFSSGCAPVLLIAGWIIAASLEGPAYDPITQEPAAP